MLQVMVTNVTSLLKTVKAVEDEATRGTRALEATIECIKQELTVRNILCVYIELLLESFQEILYIPLLKYSSSKRKILSLFYHPHAFQNLHD